ncbi:MAG TPA: transcriptional regulator, partial [Brevundimonas sp.]
MINNSYLLSLYGGASAGAAASPFSGGLGQTARKQPTPPWSSTVAPPKQDALVRAALGGRKFIDESAARLDLKAASPDYRKLFALYQGLDTLNALVNRASTKGVATLELAQLSRRFNAGLGEVGSWLSTAEFDGVRMVQGTAKTSSKTTAAVARDSANSITGPIHEGATSAPVTAFQGDVKFNITIRVPVGLT